MAANGYDTYLVARGESREENGVHVVGAGEMPKGRKGRMTKFAKVVFLKAKELDCDVYHFHDPELLRYAIKLKKAGKTVIFDSHEDVPGHITAKKWIPAPFRNPVSKLYQAYETHVVKRIDAVVAATPHIADKFKNRAKAVATVNNFPKLEDIVFHETPFTEREPIVCYVGGLSEDRGEQSILGAMKYVDGTLLIATDQVRETDDNVKIIGYQDRQGVNELYGKSIVGLTLGKPSENNYYSQPTKIYEYMAAGIPFVLSDYPIWRKAAEDSGCGIPVEQSDVKAIADAINYLLTHRSEAQEMGRKGHDYVVEHCNWKSEEKALLDLYAALT
ncbi:MAG: glycosyltransferase [Ruminococcus sp.]|nr:glycosyltransferase [Ruminococcus sp.]